MTSLHHPSFQRNRGAGVYSHSVIIRYNTRTIIIHGQIYQPHLLSCVGKYACASFLHCACWSLEYGVVDRFTPESMGKFRCYLQHIKNERWMSVHTSIPVETFSGKISASISSSKEIAGLNKKKTTMMMIDDTKFVKFVWPFSRVEN